MGIASLVLGIVSFIGGLVPLAGTFFVISAVIGLVLGIIDAVKKSRKGLPKQMAIVGIILCAVDTVGIMVYYFLFLNLVHFV